MITVKEFLAKEVRPALGCTEPGAVALAVARACDELPDRDDIASVRVTVSSSIYKNGMAVGIPGTRGARGNAIAAALGAICGRSEYGLEVLKSSVPSDVKRAEQWVRDDRVSIFCDPDRTGVYVLASVFTPSHKAVCLIDGTHAHISRVIRDGETTYQDTPKPGTDGTQTEELPADYSSVLAMADGIDDDDINFLMRGVEMNMAVAEGGFSSHEACSACGECVAGSRFGRTLKTMMETGTLSDDLCNHIRAVATAAADARMSGILLPVMSSAGSGNHGITAILPVATAARILGKDARSTAHALAVSHLVTSFIKRKIGRLSPVCGCSIAAGAGASAGLVDLFGGDTRASAAAVRFLIGNLTGMLCDGAKESCALKVGAASAEAYLCAQWATLGQDFAVPQGVVSCTVEETIENLSLISWDGMKNSDRVMIQILDTRHRPGAEPF